MKLYQFVYEVQNTADLEERFSRAYGESKRTEQGIVFENKIDNIVNIKYIYKPDERELIEQGIVLPVYAFSTALLGFSVFLWAVDHVIGSSFVPTPLSVLCSLSGLVLFLSPLIFANAKLDVFFPDGKIHELFRTKSTLPVVFRHEVKVSPLVFLNGVFTLILAAPLIQPEVNITFMPLLLLLIGFFPLIRKIQTNPATNQVLVLAALSTWPFGITMGNLHAYSQRSAFIEQEQSLVMWMKDSPFAVDNISGLLHLLIEMQMARTAVMNLIIILLLSYLAPKVIPLIIHKKSIYDTSSLITDQLFLRIGVCSMILAYMTIPLLILVFHVSGLNVIDFESMMDILFIYWVPIVIILLSIFGWIHRDYKEKLHLQKLIRSHESPLLHVQGVPVITADIGKSAAFSTQEIDSQQYILINQDLECQLSQQELLAICYHELYHLKNKTQKLQAVCELPVVGYLLFFALVNPVTIHKEEFKADDYAAEHVNREAIISALEETEAENLGPPTSPVEQFVRKEGRWVIFKLFWKVPILPLYRPERSKRINRLQNRTTPQ